MDYKPSKQKTVKKTTWDKIGEWITDNLKKIVIELSLVLLFFIGRFTYNTFNVVHNAPIQDATISKLSSDMDTIKMYIKNQHYFYASKSQLEQHVAKDESRWQDVYFQLGKCQRSVFNRKINNDLTQR
jgi:hypothetical protein